MNPGIILLYVIIAIVLIIVIVLIVIAIVNTNDIENSDNTILPPCSQNVDIGNLYQIQLDGSNDCIWNGGTGEYYYIGRNNPELNYVVARWATQPLNVCVGFCTGYTDGICTGPNYRGRTSQENFDRCMIQLTDTNCSGSTPIAAQGTYLYYPYSPTCSICENCLF